MGILKANHIGRSFTSGLAGLLWPYTRSSLPHLPFKICQCNDVLNYHLAAIYTGVSISVVWSMNYHLRSYEYLLCLFF